MKINLFLLIFKVRNNNLNYNLKTFKEIFSITQIHLKHLIRNFFQMIKFLKIKKEIYQINRDKEVLLYKYMSKMISHDHKIKF